jgi:hypothetical protein
MKTIRILTLFALLLVAGLVILIVPLGSGAVLASASSGGQKGKLHITKNCSGYTGQAGDFCTISSSNVRAIPVGSKVFYFEPLVPSTGLLDSNVVLDAGSGNRAVGRCTLDLVTNLALCTFSDGTGDLTGFHARING